MSKAIIVRNAPKTTETKLDPMSELVTLCDPETMDSMPTLQDDQSVHVPTQFGVRIELSAQDIRRAVLKQLGKSFAGYFRAAAEQQNERIRRSRDGRSE